MNQNEKEKSVKVQTDSRFAVSPNIAIRKDLFSTKEGRKKENKRTCLQWIHAGRISGGRMKKNQKNDDDDDDDENRAKQNRGKKHGSVYSFIHLFIYLSISILFCSFTYYNLLLIGC
jgi:hypothetical protein